MSHEALGRQFHEDGNAPVHHDGMSIQGWSPKNFVVNEGRGRNGTTVEGGVATTYAGGQQYSSGTNSTYAQTNAEAAELHRSGMRAISEGRGKPI